MRSIIGTLVILFLIGYLAAHLEMPGARLHASTAEIVVKDEWRRTAAGWESVDTWRHSRLAPPGQSAASRIHPLVVAALQVLVSLFALLWADRNQSVPMQRRAS